MSQAPKKKKVIATKKKLAPTSSSLSGGKSKTSSAAASAEMLFGKENFKWMFIGLGLIVLGMFLMAGGSMPSPDVWDESLIYSSRRITLAPLIIIAGLAVEVYAIFK